MRTARCSATKTNDVLAKCRKAVIAAAPDIVDAIIVKSKEGSYQHAKFLFELLGLAAKGAAAAEEEDDGRPSLAEYLIEQLHLEPPPGANPERAAGA